MDRNTLIAISKVRYYPDLKTSAGYCTPQDVLRLIKAGFKISGPYDIAIIKDKIQRGVCNSTWYYFDSYPDYIKLKNKELSYSS